MRANKAVRKIMSQKGVSLSTMAKATGRGKGTSVSAKLAIANPTFDSVVEMLNVLGYEIVIQEKKPGARRADQIVIDQLDEVEE